MVCGASRAIIPREALQIISDVSGSLYPLYHCLRYALFVGESCGQGGSIDGSPCSHWHIFEDTKANRG